MLTEKYWQVKGYKNPQVWICTCSHVRNNHNYTLYDEEKNLCFRNYFLKLSLVVFTTEEPRFEFFINEIQKFKTLLKSLLSLYSFSYLFPFHCFIASFSSCSFLLFLFILFCVFIFLFSYPHFFLPFPVLLISKLAFQAWQ